MASVAADLKALRQQVEKLQIEVAGRQNLQAMVIWDGQNESSVNQETSRIREDFSGLVVHLTPELSAPNRTVEGVSNLEFEALKAEIVRALDSQAR